MLAAEYNISLCGFLTSSFFILPWTTKKKSTRKGSIKTLNQQHQTKATIFCICSFYLLLFPNYGTYVSILYIHILENWGNKARNLLDWIKKKQRVKKEFQKRNSEQHIIISQLNLLSFFWQFFFLLLIAFFSYICCVYFAFAAAQERNSK